MKIEPEPVGQPTRVYCENTTHFRVPWGPSTRTTRHKMAHSRKGHRMEIKIGSGIVELCVTTSTSFLFYSHID